MTDEPRPENTLEGGQIPGPPGPPGVPPPPYGTASYPTARQNAPSAVLALVLGIIGIVACPPVGIVALIYGNKTKREIAESGGAYNGAGMGTAGVVLGWISTALMVLLIIAVIVAIAIPTFFGAKFRAQDRGAQSNLRNALVAEDVNFVDNEAYIDNVTTLDELEPTLDFVTATGSMANDKDIYVDLDATGAVDANDTVCLWSLSDSGTYFAIGKIAKGSAAAVYFTSAPAVDATCTADEVAAWSSSWSSSF